MNVQFNPETHSIQFTAFEWIVQPVYYEMINLSGMLNRDTIYGSVLLLDNKTVVGHFSVQKLK